VLGTALSVKFSEALSAPAVEGLNVSLTVQLPPPATGLAGKHRLEVIAKSPAFAPVMDGMLPNVSVPVPVFIRVSVTCALVVPSSTEPKGTLAGRLTAGMVPVPDRGTLCKLGVALSEKVSVALSPSPVTGLNVIDTEHVAPAVTGVAGKHVLELIEKSAALGPEMLGVPANVSAAEPVFVTVTVLAGLVVPTICEPKDTLAGSPPTPGPAGVPVPASETVCIPVPALSVKTKVALAGPVVEGLNVSTTMQLTPGASACPAVHVEEAAMENAVAFVPVMFGLAAPLLLRVSVTVPVFISVTVTGIPVPPTGTEPNCTVPVGRLTVVAGGTCDATRLGALLHAEANEDSAKTTRTTESLIAPLTWELRLAENCPTGVSIRRPRVRAG
jgi:hypothetical protein